MPLGKSHMSIRSQLRKRLKGAIAPVLVHNGWRAPHGTPIDLLNGGKLFGYDEENLIRGAISKVSANTMSSFERLATIWQQVRYLDRYNISGDLVECGVWKGGTAGMMALAHLASYSPPRRNLHLFDSFQGLPEPDSSVDGVMATEYSDGHANGKLASIQKCVGALKDSQLLLEKKIAYPTDLINYHQGWFEETVPASANVLPRIALLRLDGDWYESTRVCLQNLYSKVVSGGVVVIDDYGHWEGCRKAVDEFLNLVKEPVLLNHIDYTGRFWVKLATTD